MKVGIISMQRVRNYGSYLQAYGLKKMIESLGHQVVFVDYKTEASAEESGTFKERGAYQLFCKARGKIKNAKNKVLRSLGKGEPAFFKFVRDFEKIYIRELGVPKEKHYRTEVDVLVIGSDEVFNCTQGNGIGFSKELFGADNHAGKVISYAASFGNTTMEKLENRNMQEDLKKLLKNFSALSVRDENSYNIVQELTGIKSKIHLDPVLIYDFKEDIKDIRVPKGYIIVYAYNNRISAKEGEGIRSFAESKNKRLIAISGEQPFCDEYVYCRPLEILSYFKHADYVITDTFHGTIFSVINHRKFATLVRTDQEAEGYGNQQKLGYLLKELGLERQSVKKIEELGGVLEREVDYEAVDTIIGKERRYAMDYLKEQIGAAFCE